MVTLHKKMVPLYNFQKGSQENVRVLKKTYATINAIQEWGIKYLNIPARLVRKGRKEVEMDMA